MRISDWSSDVCSSDLYIASILDAAGRLQGLIDNILDLAISDAGALKLDIETIDIQALVESAAADKQQAATDTGLDLSVQVRGNIGSVTGDRRSEEHTYELQSLMRLSYADFCLQK